VPSRILANLQAPKGSEGNRCVINCDLLNRGEQFKVGLTAIDTVGSRIIIIARAENLKCKEISEGLGVDLTMSVAGVLVALIRELFERLW
jgi:hypothetical protein